jgi:hypothetical protein
MSPVELTSGGRSVAPLRVPAIRSELWRVPTGGGEAVGAGSGPGLGLTHCHAPGDELVLGADHRCLFRSGRCGTGCRTETGSGRCGAAAWRDSWPRAGGDAVGEHQDRLASLGVDGPPVRSSGRATRRPRGTAPRARPGSVAATSRWWRQWPARGRSPRHRRRTRRARARRAGRGSATGPPAPPPHWPGRQSACPVQRSELTISRHQRSRRSWTVWGLGPLADNAGRCSASRLVVREARATPQRMMLWGGCATFRP